MATARLNMARGIGRQPNGYLLHLIIAARGLPHRRAELPPRPRRLFFPHSSLPGPLAA